MMTALLVFSGARRLGSKDTPPMDLPAKDSPRARLGPAAPLPPERGRLGEVAGRAEVRLANRRRRAEDRPEDPDGVMGMIDDAENCVWKCQSARKLVMMTN